MSHRKYLALFIVPTNPTNLRVKAENPGELHVTWDPPLKPNGNVTHYEVYWQLRDLVPESYEQRDYCSFRKFKLFFVPSLPFFLFPVSFENKDYQPILVCRPRKG